MPRFIIGFVLLLSTMVLSCEKNEYAPLGVSEVTVAPYAIVSALVNNQSASIQIKAPITDKDEYQLELKDNLGVAISLTKGSSIIVANFRLIEFTALIKENGGNYRLSLQFPDQNVMQTIERQFQSRENRNWQRLSHAPIFSGDFTGTLLSSDLSNQIGICRYASAEKWDILQYVGSKWESAEGTYPLPRHNPLAFVLNDGVQKETIFIGFGYQTNEQLPGKKAYLNDFWWSFSYYYYGKFTTFLGTNNGIVLPVFDRNESDLKYFQTSDNAYILKENSTGEMLSFNLTWDRKYVRPFPENTGHLACFFMEGTGYVINQFSGQKPHLYAYDVEKDTWTRKADFPGATNDNGTGFSAGGSGYYGLGLDKDKNGVREIWKYDVSKDKWNIHSEYPGEAHQDLIVRSVNDKAYVGWGYESRKINNFSADAWVGCTDFWQFNP